MATESTLSYPDNAHPTRFTQAQLEWLPWLEPLPEAELTERHLAGLVDASRAKSPYFRLLARDPDILGARTRTDKDIFYNPEAGLPRAERELAAAAASRHNGCIYCASVHARKTSQLSKDEPAVQKLLNVAPGAELAHGQNARWAAIIDLVATLSITPAATSLQQLDALRDQGLNTLALLDVIQSAAFFAWANRLMLTLGEPFLPEHV